jgi:hypothetical protein
VWCDAGKHFRNNEVLGYFLLELAREKIHGGETLDVYFMNKNLTLYYNCF